MYIGFFGDFHVPEARRSNDEWVIASKCRGNSDALMFVQSCAFVNFQ